MRGRVLGCHSDLAVVQLTDGREVRCRLRGRLRLQRSGIQPAVVAGDLVEVGLHQGSHVVEEVLPRRNLLPRPLVANVDQVLVVFARDEPPLDVRYVGRVLVTAERAGLDGVLVLSKADLLGLAEEEEVRSLFTPVPYPLVVTSAVTGRGLEELRGRLQGRVSVLAGPSGVGKSRLLNALHPGLSLQTGELSRLKRGRHTTRLARLLPVAGGTVADTPGFSAPALVDVPPREVASLFPEFDDLALRCRFSDCYHRSEPGCAVREAVETGQVARWRYDLYLDLVEESEAGQKW